ncbi:unnamed protein product [Amaranthus hypochondriacus]
MSQFEVNYDDEVVNSPLSQIYLCQAMDQTTMNCALGLKHPITVETLKKVIINSIMIKHPRFCSLIVRDHKGREHWRKTHVNIDDHIIVHQTQQRINHDEDEEEAEINSFLAEIAVSTPLNGNKPLWEFHVLMGLNCVVLRVHHALGDAASLMSMLYACFGKEKEVNNCVENDQKRKYIHAKREWKEKGIWGLIKSLWFTFVFGLNLLGRFLWVKDKVSVVSGGDGVELWPRKVVTAKFLLEDFKSIKKVIPNVTINDVLLGIISSGLSKYLNIKSPQALRHGLQLTTFVAVNLRKDPFMQEKSELMKISSNCALSGWGNKSVAVTIPIICNNKELHPLHHVRALKAIMDKKKLSYEPHFGFILNNFFISCLGPKIFTWFIRRIFCNTSLIISNIMGPQEEMAIADNPIKYVRLNISSLPHAITLHMVSYAGKADLQVMVAKDIISDPEVLVNCFYDSLLQMKNSIY